MTDDFREYLMKKVMDVEYLVRESGHNEKLMTHVFATFIPCYSTNDTLDLGWKECKDFKFDKFLNGYTFRLCDL